MARISAGPMKDKIIGYLKETLAEMRKVVWPDQRYVTVATIIILVLVCLTGIFVMTIDFGLGKLFTALTK
jgi:preprotein translocase SecE subunit